MTTRLDRYAMLSESGIDELSLPTQSFESLCKLVDTAIAAKEYDFECTYDVRSGVFLPAPELSESHPFVQVFMEGVDGDICIQIVWKKGTIEFLDRNVIGEIGQGILDIGDSLPGYEAWWAYFPLSRTTGRSGLVEALEFCCFLSNWFSSDPIRVILSFTGCNDLKWVGGIDDQIFKTDSYLASHLWPAAVGLGVPPSRVFKQTQAVTDLSTAPRRAPADSYDFEILCGEWMSWFGVRDVKVSPPGKDGGVDVTGMGVIAESKFHPSQKVAEPDVRDLIGCRLIFGVNHAWFFHYGPGYPESVVKLCQEGLAELFQFDSTTLSFAGLMDYAAALCRGGTKHTA